MSGQSRRHFLQRSLALVSLGLLSGCGVLPVPWQRPAKVHRIGLLQFGTSTASAPFRAALSRGLQELGYVEGQNIVIEQRLADGRLERLPGLAAELATLNLDVILAGNSDAIRAIQHVSSTIPIVFPAAQDPVANGLVASLARPGGNVTGLSITAGLEAAKRLDLLKEVMPGMSRVAILWDRYSAVRYRETVVAAQTLGVGYLSLEFQDTSDLDAILASAGTGGVDGLIVTGSFQISALEQRIVDIAMRDRVPAMYSIVTAVPRGGLLAYAPNILENYRRAATYVDKILTGAKPADLPVELPTEFELVVNLKTAQALGLTIPRSVLQQATEVIQ